MQSTAVEFQRRLIDFVRAFGLHQPERTACGQPIGTSEAHALGVLVEHAPLRVTQLARELVLDKSTVSRLVGSLTQRGWAKLAHDASDRRVRIVTLTPAGARAAARLQAARSRHFTAVLQKIEPSRRDEVLAAIEEMTTAARAATEPGSDAKTA